MQSSKKRKSSWVPYLVLGLLLSFLWAALWKGEKSFTPSEKSDGQVKSSLVMGLPHILAPIIRHELPPGLEEDNTHLMVYFKLPDLFQIFMVRQ